MGVFSFVGAFFIVAVVPFIDVCVDWIDSRTCLPVDDADNSPANPKNGDEMQLDSSKQDASPAVSLQDFLESTPW